MVEVGQLEGVADEMAQPDEAQAALDVAAPRKVIQSPER